MVVVLHGEPGVGRTALALRAADALRDQFRGACVVDLRGGSVSGEAPLPLREALLHLLNRLGAPREQLLFREGSSAEQQVRRLGELYHQHLQGLPVTVLLDDAVDAAQVRMLVPERSESLVLVTAREPLELPDLAAWVHQLPVERLAEVDGAELVRAGAEAAGAAPYEEGALQGLLALGGGSRWPCASWPRSAAPPRTPPRTPPRPTVRPTPTVPAGWRARWAWPTYACPRSGAGCCGGSRWPAAPRSARRRRRR